MQNSIARMHTMNGAVEDTENKGLFRFSNWPLRLKIVLLLFVSSALPLVVAGTIEYQYERDRVLENEGSLLTARGDEVVGKLDDFNNLYRLASERVSAMPAVSRYVFAPPASRGELAADTLATLGAWPKLDANIRGVAILDIAGTAILATEDVLLDRNLSSYRYVQEALKGNPVISDLYISDHETGSTPTIAYLAPIRDENHTVAAVAVIWVRASAFWEVVKAGNELAGEKSFSVLFDQYGIRIAHSYNQDIVFHPGGRLDPATIDAMAAERRFGDRTREFLEDSKDFPNQFDLARSPSPGREVFRGFAPVNQKWNIGVPRRFTSAPWTLFYMIPEESLDAPIRALILRTMLLTGGVILLAIIAGLIISRGILGSIRLISEAALALGSSANQITASTTQIASGSAETATAVSQTASTVDEVKQTAEISAQKARYVSEMAQKTAQISQSGRKSVEGSIEVMHHIQEQMESVAGGIVRLSEHSQAIGEIIATMNDLAEQSNLLAVNAAIEATTAGEQGKRFGVVAQEIKILAEQSKQATAQVRSILGDIQKAMNSAVMATEQESKAVETGVKLSGEVGEAIRLLAESITESAQAAMQIAASSQQQQAGMSQVALAMENIRQASTQNAASTKQAEAVAQNLSDLGQKLARLVKQYGF